MQDKTTKDQIGRANRHFDEELARYWRHEIYNQYSCQFPTGLCIFSLEKCVFPIEFDIILLQMLSTTRIRLHLILYLLGESYLEINVSWTSLRFSNISWSKYELFWTWDLAGPKFLVQIMPLVNNFWTRIWTSPFCKYTLLQVRKLKFLFLIMDFLFRPLLAFPPFLQLFQ